MSSSDKDSPTLRKVCHELGRVQHKAYRIGIELGLPHHEMQNFKQENILSSVANFWLCGNVPDVPVTWEYLAEALKSDFVGESSLAQIIFDKYCCQPEKLTATESEPQASTFHGKRKLNKAETSTAKQPKNDEGNERGGTQSTCKLGDEMALHTPLTLASKENHCETLTILLNRGADVNETTKRNWTSLMLAAHYGHVQAGKLLLERGAKIDCCDDKKYTPLAQASQNGHYMFVQMLIDHDSSLDLNVTEPGGWTPLMLACKNGHTEVACELLKNGADIEKQKPDGINALHIAAFAGHTDTVDVLIKYNANVNATDKSGVTALMYATKKNCFEVVNTLLDSGADLNHQEMVGGISAPFIAAQEKNDDLLSFFKGNTTLDTNIKDRDGHTVDDLADLENREAHANAARVLHGMEARMGVITRAG